MTKATNFDPLQRIRANRGENSATIAANTIGVVSDAIDQAIEAATLRFVGADVEEGPDEGEVTITLRTGVKNVLNASGSDVGIYAVVVTDPSTDNAIVTTTTPQVTQRGIGVTQAAIAAGAIGPVMFAGETPVALAAAAVRGTFLETSSSAGEAGANATRREGSFGVLLEGADPADIGPTGAAGLRVDSATTVLESPASSFVVDMPATTPDGLVLLLAVWRDPTQATTTITATGWTRIGADDAFTYFYRIASAEPATYTVTFGAARKALATVLTLTGVDPGAPVVDHDYDATSAAAAISGLTTGTYLVLAGVQDVLASAVAGWDTLSSATTDGLDGVGDLGTAYSTTAWKVWRESWVSGAIGGTPSGWETVGFDDSGWETPDNIGFGGPPGYAIIPHDAFTSVTLNGLHWLARSPVFSLAAIPTAARLDVNWDDDVEVYVNGTLVYSHTGVGSTTIDVAANLIVGPNVLAVRIVNATGSNTYGPSNGTRIYASLAIPAVEGALVARFIDGTAVTSPFASAAAADDALFALGLTVIPFIDAPVARCLLWGGDADLDDGSAGFSGIAEDLTTAETDTGKRLAPDGVGGVDWVAESGGTAATTSVADAGGYFAGTDVEAVLQELAAKDIGYQAHGAMGATETFDAAKGWHSGTFDAACTFTFTGATAGLVASMVLELTENGTGGYSPTFPGSVVWPGGTTPTHDTIAGTTTIYLFQTRDGGTTWYGFQAGGGAVGMANPMTAQDDVIVGGSVTGGVAAPARLGKGSDGQVLTVDPTTHHLVWATPASALSNPMTTVGDIIVGGTVTGGVAAPARLGRPNDATQYLDGTGAYSVPAGGGGGGAGADAITGQVGTGGAIIPGLQASPDIRVAGASDDEFDSTDTSDPMTGWTTLGTPTAHDINSTALSHYYLKRNASASVALAGIYKAWSPSAGSKVTCKLSDAALISDNGCAGLFLGEATPGKINSVMCQFVTTTAPTIRVTVDAWTNPTTFSSTPGTATRAMTPPMYFRIVYTNSTSVTFQASFGGYVWIDIVTARNPSFTVGSAGLLVNPPTSTWPVEALYDWIRFS